MRLHCFIAIAIKFMLWKPGVRGRGRPHIGGVAGRRGGLGGLVGGWGVCWGWGGGDTACILKYGQKTCVHTSQVLTIINNDDKIITYYT